MNATRSGVDAANRAVNACASGVIATPTAAVIGPSAVIATGSAVIATRSGVHAFGSGVHIPNVRVSRTRRGFGYDGGPARRFPRLAGITERQERVFARALQSGNPPGRMPG